MGLQAGFTKSLCYLCLWDSRNTDSCYHKRDWQLRMEFLIWQKNVKRKPHRIEAYETFFQIFRYRLSSLQAPRRPHSKAVWNQNKGWCLDQIIITITDKSKECYREHWVPKEACEKENSSLEQVCGRSEMFPWESQGPQICSAGWNSG